eukprot:Phypoly_transcript_14519.p1 GENE.Phypoly_transcript_14519~~Phypoly_transcript_14519.p1  ORF type:complete len:127 (+),score=24.12 Phypoly_transcript_14519:512-892(+)
MISIKTRMERQVSKEELLAGVENHFIGKKPSELPDWWKIHVTTVINILDHNKNGELSLEECTKNIQHWAPSISAEKISAAYEWLIKHSITGKADAAAFSDIVVYQWATNPEPTPEADILAPFFHKN